MNDRNIQLEAQQWHDEDEDQAMHTFYAALQFLTGLCVFALGGVLLWIVLAAF